MNEKPKISISNPLTFKQQLVFVLEGSQAMNEKMSNSVTKAEAVNVAIKGLLTRLKISRQKENFLFSIIAFSDIAIKMAELEKVSQFNEKENYNPFMNRFEKTKIYSGIELAKDVAYDYIASTKPKSISSSVVIILFANGRCQNPEKTKEIIHTIRKGEYGDKITICTVFIGNHFNPNESAIKFLKEIASNERTGFKTIFDAESLRSFFAKSISSSFKF